MVWFNTSQYILLCAFELGYLVGDSEFLFVAHGFLAGDPEAPAGDLEPLSGDLDALVGGLDGLSDYLDDENGDLSV